MESARLRGWVFDSVQGFLLMQTDLVDNGMYSSDSLQDPLRSAFGFLKVYLVNFD